MGHESPIEPWLPLTTCSACESQSSWLHANKTMKTTGRKRQNPQALPLEVDNSTGHNTPTSLRLGWTQDRLQPPEECFLLTSSRGQIRRSPPFPCSSLGGPWSLKFLPDGDRDHFYGDREHDTMRGWNTAHHDHLPPGLRNRDRLPP